MDAGRRRVALLLEYDGTAYAGSQLQKDAVTVQSVLEAAIQRTTGEPCRVAFAGRTDAGCHAHGQVAAFETQSRLEARVLQRALNAWLPRDVAVRDVADVEPGFDPRRQACRRTYRYLVENRPARPALDRARAWHVAAPLGVDSMSRAATSIIGRHDFAAFASPLEDETASTVRELMHFDVSRDGTRICFEVAANAFLPHQVRRMVGALVQVGKGRLSEAEYALLLDGPPASAGPVAPAHGLSLMAVEYEKPLFEAAAVGVGASVDSTSYLC